MTATLITQQPGGMPVSVEYPSEAAARQRMAEVLEQWPQATCSVVVSNNVGVTLMERHGPDGVKIYTPQDEDA